MDIEYLLWLQNIRNHLGPVMEAVFNGISLLGIAALVFGFIIYLCYSKKNGLFILTSFTLGTVVNNTIKNIVCCYRPWIRDSRVKPSKHALKGATGYSFPSGHSQTGACVYGAIGWRYRTRKALKWLMIILIILVPFSRNYLGVHTPQDVITGTLEGLFMVFLTQKIFDWYEKGEHHDLWIMISGLLVDAALILFTICKSYPMNYENGKLVVNPIVMQADALKAYGFFAGFLIGGYLEHRYVNFSTDQLDLKKRIIRLVITGIPAGIGYLIGHMLKGVIGVRTADFIGAFLAMLCVMYLGPYVFTKKEKKESVQRVRK